MLLRKILFPVDKDVSGFAAVAAFTASKCTSKECLQATIGKLARTPPVVGISTAIMPVFATGTAPGALSSTLPNILQTIRGGAATTAVVNFPRESLTLQGMATYGTITALIMNASLRLWTSTSFSNDQNKIVPNVFNIANAICMLSGVFTAILFQLLTIYSKSALGMGNDVGYMAFKEATKTFRIFGFHCFLTEMMSFLVCFMMHLYNTLWNNARQRGHKSLLTPTGNVVMGGSVILMVVGIHLIRSVLSLASLHIFSA